MTPASFHNNRFKPNEIKHRANNNNVNGRIEHAQEVIDLEKEDYCQQTSDQILEAMKQQFKELMSTGAQSSTSKGEETAGNSDREREALINRISQNREITLMQRNNLPEDDVIVII